MWPFRIALLVVTLFNLNHVCFGASDDVPNATTPGIHCEDGVCHASGQSLLQRASFDVIGAQVEGNAIHAISNKNVTNRTKKNVSSIVCIFLALMENRGLLELTSDGMLTTDLADKNMKKAGLTGTASEKLRKIIGSDATIPIDISLLNMPTIYGPGSDLNQSGGRAFPMTTGFRDSGIDILGAPQPDTFQNFIDKYKPSNGEFTTKELGLWMKDRTKIMEDNNFALGNYNLPGGGGNTPLIHRSDAENNSPWISVLAALSTVFSLYSRPPSTSFGSRYMTEQDLRDIFMEAKLPAHWKLPEEGGPTTGAGKIAYHLAWMKYYQGR